METRIELYDKYTVIHNDGKLKALRYNEEWRDLTGDGLILALFDKIVEQNEKLKEIDKLMTELYPIGL